MYLYIYPLFLYFSKFKIQIFSTKLTNKITILLFFFSRLLSFSFSFFYPTPSPHSHLNPRPLLFNRKSSLVLHRLVGLQGGHDLYDPMKAAGYSHLDTSQRYDMLGMQTMHRSDMYGSPPSSYTAQMAQFSPPVHSQAMLIPGHPHHMMVGHGNPAMAHHGMTAAQSPPLHMEGMGAHIQDIHAG